MRCLLFRRQIAGRMEMTRYAMLLLTVLLAFVHGAAAGFPTGDAGMFLAVLILCLIILTFTGVMSFLYFVVYRRTCDKGSRSAEI